MNRDARELVSVGHGKDIEPRKPSEREWLGSLSPLQKSLVGHSRFENHTHPLPDSSSLPLGRDSPQGPRQEANQEQTDRKT